MKKAVGAAGLVVLGMFLHLLVSSPGAVAVSADGQVHGPLNQVREWIQGQRFWRGQLDAIDRELAAAQGLTLAQYRKYRETRHEIARIVATSTPVLETGGAPEPRRRVPGPGQERIDHLEQLRLMVAGRLAGAED